jgi:hypothetical protein
VPKEPSKAWNAEHSMIPTERKDVTKVTPLAEMCQKEPSKAWNAEHSMIPTERRDVTKVTPIGT